MPAPAPGRVRPPCPVDPGSTRSDAAQAPGATGAACICSEASSRSSRAIWSGSGSGIPLLRRSASQNRIVCLSGFNVPSITCGGNSNMRRGPVGNGALAAATGPLSLKKPGPSPSLANLSRRIGRFDRAPVNGVRRCVSPQRTRQKKYVARKNISWADRKLLAKSSCLRLLRTTLA